MLTRYGNLFCRYLNVQINKFFSTVSWTCDCEFYRKGKLLKGFRIMSPRLIHFSKLKIDTRPFQYDASGNDDQIMLIFVMLNFYLSINILFVTFKGSRMTIYIRLKSCLTVYFRPIHIMGYRGLLFML